MRRCYDFDKRRLFLDVLGITFDLDLRYSKIVVTGNSATGKTLLVNSIKGVRAMRGAVIVDTSNIFILEDSNIDIYKSGNVHKSLVIIDRADLIVDDEIRYMIRNDSGQDNNYLLFARTGLQIDVTPNCYGEFIEQNGIISIYYEFNVKQWNIH